MPSLETARLTVRPFVTGDVDAYMDAFASAPEESGRVRAYLRWAALNHEALADLRQPPYGDRAVVLRENGTLVGAVGLVPLLGPFGAEAPLFTTEVGLYWAVAPGHRRRGFATEAARALIDYAFGRLRLARVVAVTEAANAPSIAVMRRLGMRIERREDPDPHWLQVVGVLRNDLKPQA